MFTAPSAPSLWDSLWGSLSRGLKTRVSSAFKAYKAIQKLTWGVLCVYCSKPVGFSGVSLSRGLKTRVGFTCEVSRKSQKLLVLG